MSERAHVKSIDALESFRSRLIVYRQKARRALDDVSDEVNRTRLWLQNDQRLYWERELRQRRGDLERRQQELMSVRLSSFREPTPVEQAAVRRAKQAVQEAEAKRTLVREWNRRYDSRVVPYAKGADVLRQFLAEDMAGAVAHLTQAITALDAYAEIRPSAASQPARPTDEVEEVKLTSASSSSVRPKDTP